MQDTIPLVVAPEFVIKTDATNGLISYMQNAYVTKEGDQVFIEKRNGYHQVRTQSGGDRIFGGYHWANDVSTSLITGE